MTAEVSHLLSQVSLEDATCSKSPLSSVHSVTVSSFTQNPVLSAGPPGHVIPASQPKSSLSPPSVLTPEQVTSLVNSLSPSALAGSVPWEPSPALEFKFLVNHFPLEAIFSPLLPSHRMPEAEPVFQPEAALSIFDDLGDVSPTDLNPADASFGEYHPCYQRKSKHLGFLSPDTHALLKSEQKKTDDFMIFPTRNLLYSWASQSVIQKSEPIISPQTRACMFYED